MVLKKLQKRKIPVRWPGFLQMNAINSKKRLQNQKNLDLESIFQVFRSIFVNWNLLKRRERYFPEETITLAVLRILFLSL